MKKQYIGDLQLKGKEDGKSFLIEITNAVVETDVEPQTENDVKGIILNYDSMYYAKTLD